MFTNVNCVVRTAFLSSSEKLAEKRKGVFSELALTVSTLLHIC